MSFYSYVVLGITITVQTLDGFTDVLHSNQNITLLHCTQNHYFPFHLHENIRSYTFFYIGATLTEIPTEYT